MAKSEPLAITEAELHSLTKELDDRHHETLGDMHKAGAQYVESVNDTASSESALSKFATSRRGFLLGALGLGAGGALLAACGASASTTTTAAPKANPTAHVDLEIAVLAASLENLAVSTYTAGINAATAGKLGTVPPAVVTFATTARSQHADHAKAWNSIVTSLGYKSVSSVDPALKATVASDLGKVTDVVSLAKLALNLEGIAAATYLEALYGLSSKQALAIAASIQPVEAQHVAILNFVLGTYPVPAAFSTLTGARPVSDASSLVKK